MKDKTIHIDFRKFISSISLALDLAEACTFRDKSSRINFEVRLPDFNVHNHNFASHSKRVTLTSILIAKKMGFVDDKLDNLYVAAFLHDIGAVDAFSMSHADKDFIKDHSVFGAEILKKLPIDSSISDMIRYHHEHYDGTGCLGLSSKDIPLESSIIHIADMLELMYKEDMPNRFQRDRITQWFQKNRGKHYDPYIVDALLEVTESERFWLDIENINSDSDILERVHPVINRSITLDKLLDIAKVFAAIIDRKSNFTHQHSIGLTDHAMNFARYYGFDEEKSTLMNIAALLHDLGKLAIPNEILDKPGKLTAEEFTIIKSHTYYTKLILNKIGGLDKVSSWAADHHETLRGTGYPERINAEQLSKEARIVAICDVYQALTEDRPYRPGMTKEKAVSIIESMVERGDLDREVFEDLKKII